MNVRNLLAVVCTTLVAAYFRPIGASAQARLIIDHIDTVQSPTPSLPRGDGSIDSVKTSRGTLPSEEGWGGTADSAAIAKLNATSDSILAVNTKAMAKQKQTQFVPDPKRALWLALVLPGAGQIYNRKYWKLPIIYGGFIGCTYALLWNQQMYRDYSQAYLDIMDDDPNTKSYMDMLPPRYDITGREEQFKNVFKRKKDYYRRYRDLSAFCFIGVYLISVIDAYVDAQLSVFDISPDLSMRLQPAVITTTSPTTQTRSSYGIGCSLNF